MLLSRNIHTHQSRHSFQLPFLTLALLVTRVGADHAHNAFAADYAAVLANATNGATYFHDFLLLFRVVEYLCSISKMRLIAQGGNFTKI
jgi:hypothetical protein